MLDPVQAVPQRPEIVQVRQDWVMSASAYSPLRNSGPAGLSASAPLRHLATICSALWSSTGDIGAPFIMVL